MEKRSNIAKALYMGVTTFFKKGWFFGINAAKATTLCLKRKLTGERPVFTEFWHLEDPSDWGASMDDCRSGRSKKELFKKDLYVAGTPECILEKSYYMTYNGCKIELSEEQFNKLIPNR